MVQGRSTITLTLLFLLASTGTVRNAPMMERAPSMKGIAFTGEEELLPKEHSLLGVGPHQEESKLFAQPARKISEASTEEFCVAKARALPPAQDRGGYVSSPKSSQLNKMSPKHGAPGFFSEASIDCSAQPYPRISEREPNDNPSQAQMVTPPIVINGFDAPGGCLTSGCWCFDANDNNDCDPNEDHIEDWYGFTLRETATVRIAICVPDPVGVIFNMVISPNIRGANQLPGLAGFSGAPPSSIAITLEPGNYLIPVSLDDFRSVASDYSLVIEVTPVLLDHTLGFANSSGRSSDPVNTATGNYTFQDIDLAIPGRGLPLVFQRTYNSQDFYQGPFGGGWTHNYNIFLYEILDILFIKWGDGRVDAYRKGRTGSYQSIFPDIYDQLVKRSDGIFILTKKDKTQYLFDTEGRLSSIVDKNGNTIQLKYYSSGTLRTITDTVGHRIILSYLPNGRLVQLTDLIGRRVIRYTYDENGNLASVIDARGGTTEFFYDAGQPLTKIIDARGNTLVENTYDRNGRVIAQANGSGLTTTFAYDTPAPRQTSITDPLGNTTIHFHDNQLRLIQDVDPLGNSISFEYDANGNRTKMTDKNSNSTMFSYDNRGNISSIIDPLGNRTTIEYDSINNPIRRTDARGNITTYSYDSRGNLLSITDALGNTTVIPRNSSGQPVALTDANGNTTSFAYDNQGNLIRITDALGNGTAFTYDGVGRRTSVTDANGNTTNSAYDANDNLISVDGPLGSSARYAYDKSNNRTRVTDPNGNTTIYTYDANNLLTSITDPLGNVSSFAYDALNNRARFTDPNGNTISYSYDPLGRLAVITYPDGTSITFKYDPSGNRTKMVDQHGTTTYHYDALNCLVEVTDTDNMIVQYAYDAVGNRISLVYPGDKLVRYTYDELNRLKTVTDWIGGVTMYNYDPVDTLISTVNPNNTKVVYKYDEANRLIELINSKSDGSIIAAYQYTLDQVGNQISVRLTEPLRMGTVSYFYDDLNRLKRSEETTNVQQRVSTYDYDPAGNRIQLATELSSAIIRYAYDEGNRLLTANGMSFDYDKNGNLIRRVTGGSVANYQYDFENRLVRVFKDGDEVRYQYDGVGNRIAVIKSSGETQYILDADFLLNHVLVEMDASRNITAYYVHGLGIISKILPSGNAFYYHYDRRGSTVGLTDGRGNWVAQYTYGDFGNVSAPTRGIDDQYNFIGRHGVMQENNLFFMKNRFYDPAIGRFINKDPVTGLLIDPQTINRYAYVKNNPIILVDPSGLLSRRAQLQANILRIGNINFKNIENGLKSIGKFLGQFIKSVLEMHAGGIGTSGEIAVEARKTKRKIAKQQMLLVDFWIDEMVDDNRLTVKDITRTISREFYLPGLSEEIIQTLIFERINERGLTLSPSQLDP